MIGWVALLLLWPFALLLLVIEVDNALRRRRNR